MTLKIKSLPEAYADLSAAFERLPKEARAAVEVLWDLELISALDKDDIDRTIKTLQVADALFAQAIKRSEINKTILAKATQEWEELCKAKTKKRSPGKSAWWTPDKEKDLLDAWFSRANDVKKVERKRNAALAFRTVHPDCPLSLVTMENLTKLEHENDYQFSVRRRDFVAKQEEKIIKKLNELIRQNDNKQKRLSLAYEIFHDLLG